MNKTTMKVLAVLLVLTMGAMQAATAQTTGVHPDYISPGIGTLLLSWLSRLR